MRFPEFNGEWEKKRISEFCTLLKGTGISKDQLSTNGNPCILYGELYTKYKAEIINEVLSCTELDANTLVKSKVNDVIIPCSGETAIDIATARYVPFDDVLLGGDLNILRSNKVNGSFLAYQLNGKRKYDIARVAQGVSVVHLYGEHLKNIVISLPVIEEQQKISRLLHLLDERIATQNKIIEKLQSLIKGITILLTAKGKPNYLTAISNYDLRYLYFVLSVFNFQSYKTGMAIPHIYFKDYGNAKIFCPPLSEQKRIANVLGKLESKLCLEQNILASFNLQKRYLLGQMFI